MTIQALTPRPAQEAAINLALAEIGRSNGTLIGDEPGAGKTLIGVEFVLRAGFERVLFIGLPDTHKQWAAAIERQSGGTRGARIMNGTKAGRAEFEAFMNHEPGFYIAGSHFLAEKDWGSVPVRDAQGKVQHKIDKTTRQIVLKPRSDGPFHGELLLVDRAEGVIGPAQEPYIQHAKTGKGVIGPALEPVIVTKPVRKNVFARFARKPLDAVIFDECQVIANKKAHGRMTILSIKSNFRMAMSGTWFLNNVSNMWSIARWVWPGEKEDGTPYVDTSHERWTQRYLKTEVVYGKGGRALETPRGDTIKKVTGERNPGEFVSTLPAYRRIENEDRVPEALVVRVDATPEQRAQIEDLERDLMTWVQNWDGQEAPLVVDIPMVLRIRLRQVAIAELSLTTDVSGEEIVTFADDAASAKMAPLRYLVDTHWAGQPVGIYTDSKLGAHFITKRMQRAGYKAAAWTGDLSRTQRDELKASFLAGEFDYLVGTVQSMGTGIDGLQGRVNKVVWISEADGNPALNEQAIARYFRPGRTIANGGFEHVKIIMNDSVDEISLEALVAKAWSVRTAMNGGIAA